MSNTSVAASADFADALFSARRAKDVLVGLLLIILLLQLGLFFAARYRIDLNGPAGWVDKLKYLVGLADFLGVVLPIVLAVVLLLIVLVMVIGRLIGVSHVVSAFVACVVLGTLLFPWQAFLMNQTFNSSEFKVPGVLYTWAELVLRAREHPQGLAMGLMYWARFVGWPVAALAILAKIYLRSSKGIRSALHAPARMAVDELPAIPGKIQ